MMIATERDWQKKKWGVQLHSAERWMLILTEEVGELAQAVLQERPGALRKELVQVAAVALAWIEARMVVSILTGKPELPPEAALDAEADDA